MKKAAMPDDPVQRRLAEILCADVTGYSRLVDDDEVGTVRRLGEYRETLCSFVIRHHGRVVNAPGDAVLAEYQSVVDAVQSAVEIQRELEARNDSLPAEQRMSFRIGINLGDVIVENDDIYGEGVNISARLQTIAEPGGICISRPVHDQVHNKLTLGYEFLGERSVKNIAEPQGVFRIEMDPTAARRSKAPPRAAPDSSVAVGEGITTVPQSSRWIPPPGDVCLARRARRARRAPAVRWADRYGRSLLLYWQWAGYLVVGRYLSDYRRTLS